MNNYISTLTSVSTDTIIIVLVIALLLFVGFKFGRNYLVSLILSLYITAFLYQSVFFINNLIFVGKETKTLFWNHLAVFLLFLIPINLLIHRRTKAGYDGGGNKLFKIGMLTVVCAGLVFAILYHVVPIEPTHNFSQGIDKLFALNKVYTLWLLLPLITLFF